MGGDIVGAPYEYDIFVIGTGPAGQRAAIQSAKLGKRVAIVDRERVVGGVCTNTGTIPSKTLREAVMRLSGYRDRGLYGESYSVKTDLTMEDLLDHVGHVRRHEIDVIRHQLRRNGVEVLEGHASFVDPHAILLRSDDGAQRVVRAGIVVIGTGTVATRDPHIPFDGQRVLISDDIVQLERLPRTMAVVGAGVIGLEYATMFAALGVRVVLMDKRPRLLPFVDQEITDALAYHLRSQRATLRFGEEVAEIASFEDRRGQRVRIRLASGKEIVTECTLYSIGRTGATDSLELGKAGLEADERGRIVVDDDYRTAVPHIYAVGDVIGFPSLASTSMEQGRLAACHAFGMKARSVPELFPMGIYTIPEISTVGRDEETLTEQGIPYEVGKAHYREISRGQILGDSTGFLKLIFHLETRKLLGVHIIGEGATELIHIGQAVMAFGGAVDYFINNVFNFPTLAECYKTAAFDGINRLEADILELEEIEPADPAERVSAA